MSNEWICTLHGRILCLKQDAEHLHYKAIWPKQETNHPSTSSLSSGMDRALYDDTEDLIRQYFSLDLNLGHLYEQWSEADSNFHKKALEFTGIRILSQDAWEALICFICSSNNNISRISQMVHKLCNHYGLLIGHIDGVPLHDFPTAKALTDDGVESHLRELGFGYRAKYIAHTARVVALEKPTGWLDSLRNPLRPGPRVSRQDSTATDPTYKEAHEALLSLAGVGPKVADCVCLMGLGWGESVPVDTHVWQIAQRDYKFGKSKTRTFNKAMYDAVGDHFRKIWGDYAGWAHSVVFTADLREFSGRKAKAEAVVPGEVKTEVMEDLGFHGPPKRKSAAQALLRINTKVEDVEGSNLVHMTASYKRRRIRTRS